MTKLRESHGPSRLNGVAAWIAVALLTYATSLPAESQIELVNGTQIQGDLLKKTPTAYYIDLGFDILRIPNENVLQFETLLGEGEVEPALEIGKAVPTEAKGAEGLAPRNLRGVTYFERTEDAAFDSIGEMVEETRLGVVHIKAPSKRGTGFLINKRGYVISNFHVVQEEKFLDVTVYYREGREVKTKTYHDAELVAFSQLMDISLIHIKDEDLNPDILTPLPIADGKTYEAGTVSVAIGNPGMGAMALDQTVSEGIVSSNDRNFNDIIYLQTTAAVNPGNSGGPLLNGNGEVIGLVTYKAFLQDNIGFALPANYIRYFIERQQAFAYPEDKLNTGIRYLPPL